MNRLKAALTPCVGRCSTVFGDSVCRGCRRFSHEVIDWNRYTTAQRDYIWQRLDQQLDQIVLPVLPLADLPAVREFLQARHVRVPENASFGRYLHEALRLCQRQPALLVDSGLGIASDQIENCWQRIEQRIFSLAVASYEFAWLRAAQIQSPS